MAQTPSLWVLFASLLWSTCLATPRPTELSSFETRERPAKSLSLRQAVIGATTHHPAVKSAEINVELGTLAEQSAWAGFLPTLNIKTNSYGDKNSGTYQIEAAITGNQHLIGFAGPKQKAAQAKVDTKIASLSRDLTVQQRRALVEDVFLQAWLKQEEYALWERQFDASSENLRVKKRQHDAGLLTDADYEASIAETTDIESSLESNRDELQSLIGELEDATGYTLSDDDGVFCTLQWQPEIDQPIQPVSFYLDTAFSHRLELDLNNAARERALEDEKYASGKVLPTLSAIGQYSCGYSPGSTPTDPTVAASGFTQRSFFAGLQTSWNVFDGMQSKLETEAARARALKSSTEREITKKKISKEIKKIHSSLKATQKRTKALQAELKATQENHRLSQSLNTAGINTDADVQTADAKSYKTQFACLSQVVAFQRSLFALNAACGYALDTLTT